MNSIETKDNSVAIENDMNITQVNQDKCFYIAAKFSSWNQLKEEKFIATKKILSRNDIHSSQQRATGLCRNKDYFYRGKQNMREVNSLS